MQKKQKKKNEKKKNEKERQNPFSVTCSVSSKHTGIKYSNISEYY